jgi:transposase
MAANKLAQLAKVLEKENAQSFNIWIDVHKLSYHLAFRRSDGQTHTFVSPADPLLLVRMIENAKIEVAQIAYEAGPTGFKLARMLLAAGLPVIVVAPSKTPRPVSRDAKTDRLDCIKLAEFSARGMLSGIAVPTETEEADRALVRRRHDVVEDIKRIKLSQVSSFGNRRQGPFLLQREVPCGYGTFAPAAIDPSCGSKPNASFKIPGRGKKDPGKGIALIMHSPDNEEVTACLKSVPGVGEITAATFRAEIFRPERFENAGQVTSLVGLAPVVRQSGLKKPVGRLAPTGQKRLRALLLEAAWIWRSKDPGAKDFYQKMVSKTGLPQKAIAAVARKLCVILWTLAVEKRPYRLAAAA